VSFWVALFAVFSALRIQFAISATALFAALTFGYRQTSFSPLLGLAMLLSLPGLALHHSISVQLR